MSYTSTEIYIELCERLIGGSCSERLWDLDKGGIGGRAQWDHLSRVHLLEGKTHKLPNANASKTLTDNASCRFSFHWVGPELPVFNIFFASGGEGKFKSNEKQPWAVWWQIVLEGEAVLTPNWELNLRPNPKLSGREKCICVCGIYMSCIYIVWEEGKEFWQQTETESFPS